MKKVFLILLSTFLLIISYSFQCVARDALDVLEREATPVPQAPPSSRGLDQHHRAALERLIKMIENKQDRQQFTKDLRMLLMAEKQISQRNTSSYNGLNAFSEGLHALTAKIILFFDALQKAMGRLSHYFKNPDLTANILKGGYGVFTILLMSLAINSGLKFFHRPLRRFFVMNARQQHLKSFRLILNISFFELIIALILLAFMFLALSIMNHETVMDKILRSTVITMTLYVIMLHIIRTLFNPKYKMTAVFGLYQMNSHLIYRFLRFLIGTTVLGTLGGDMINAVDGPLIFYTALIKTMLLTQCIFTIVFILRVKHQVKIWLLAENESPNSQRKGLSSRAAQTWHVWTIIYILVFGLTIYFQTINDMKEVVISFGATAFLVATTYLLVLKLPTISHNMIEKVVRSFPHMGARHRFYGILTSFIFGIFVIMIVLYFTFKIWDIETIDFLFSDGVKPVFTALLNIFFIMLIGIFVWESNEYLIQHIFKQESHPFKNRAHRQRLATMMPLVKIIARIFILGVFVIMIFSELKLDVTPLLAGLGVIGIAFSFGSQSLVKDFITGIFILIEDTMNVGDIVQIDTQKGSVETLSLRTVKLRDTAGDLHTIPFSSINRVTNMTKNFAYYVIELVLPFEENIDLVFQVITGVDEEIRQDPKFRDYILSPVEIIGLDRFSENGAVVMARIKTVPDRHRWMIGREFNLRIKRLFNEKGIEFSSQIHKIPMRKS